MLIVARVMVGVVLMLSGFAKAIDPQGTLYKLQEYAEAIGWGTAFGDTLLTVAAIVLAATEWILGIALLMGVRRRLTTTVTMALMAVMTIISLWLWIANPVSDCGCFGDAVKLSNGKTALKNIVLLAAAVFLWRYHNSLTPLCSVTVRKLAMHLSVLYVLGIATWGVYRLPLIDFRPFHVGADIQRQMEIPKGEEAPQFETTFILEKDGVQREFTLDNYPDSTWIFVDSQTRKVKDGYVPPIHDFSVTLTDTQEDITQQLLTHTGNTVLLIAYNLDEAQQSDYGEYNHMYDAARRQGIPFYCLTASTQEQIERWQQQTAAEYPFAITDETTLKTMVRSNPGLMLIRDGVIQAKWSCNNLPQVEEVVSNNTVQATPMRQLMATALPYIVLMLLLIGITKIRKHLKTHTL